MIIKGQTVEVTYLINNETCTLQRVVFYLTVDLCMFFGIFKKSIR